MSSNNKTQIIAEEGKQELFIIREFEATFPVVPIFPAHPRQEAITIEGVPATEIDCRC